MLDGFLETSCLLRHICASRCRGQRGGDIHISILYGEGISVSYLHGISRFDALTVGDCWMFRRPRPTVISSSKYNVSANLARGWKVLRLSVLLEHGIFHNRHVNHKNCKHTGLLQRHGRCLYCFEVLQQVTATSTWQLTTLILAASLHLAYQSHSKPSLPMRRRPSLFGYFRLTGRISPRNIGMLSRPCRRPIGKYTRRLNQP